MPVPKRKTSRARKNKRFANKGIKVKAIALCQNCNIPLMPHQACVECGFYKGQKVLETKADRALKRGKAGDAKKARKMSAESAQEKSE